jgi:hypothetical protein
VLRRPGISHQNSPWGRPSFSVVCPTQGQVPHAY